MASGGDGPESEYRLASVFYQILNHRAADGSAYISVRTLLMHYVLRILVCPADRWRLCMLLSRRMHEACRTEL